MDVENLTTDQRDVDRQRQILTDLLDADFAAIGIASAHTSALDDLISEHRRRGTAVVTFHGDAPQSKGSAFVGADAWRSGALAGEVLIKLMGGRGHVLAIPGDQADSRLAGRYAGFQAELARQGAFMLEIRLDAMGTDLCAALSTNWQIADGLYIGDEDLSKIVEVLEQSRLRVPCVGFSNTALARGLLERGLVSAVVASRHQQGYFAVQKACQAAIQTRSNCWSGSEPKFWSHTKHV